MKIGISSKTNVAIYEQIVNQFRDAVVAKQLKEGELLPSIRSLAKDLQVSVITTKRAYEELEKEGVIESVPGKGFYVKKQSNDILKEKQMCNIEKRFQEVLRESKNAGMTLNDVLSLVRLLYEDVEG